MAVEAHRVRFAQQFDLLFAVNTSQVDSLPHQIEAVYHYILRSPRIRFLLADDPGAGKTIMTGLLLKELKYRSLVRRTLIVVPGHLKNQWLREMKERFGGAFTVADRSVMDATRVQHLARAGSGYYFYGLRQAGRRHGHPSRDALGLSRGR